MIPVERLTQLSFFQGMPVAPLERLAKNAQDVKLGANDFVVRQHDQAQSIFFLLSGTVQFLIHFEGADHLLVGRTKEPGALIGWSAFRIPYRYTASVRCEEPCELVRLHRAPLEELFESDRTFALAFLERVAVTLANRIEQTRELLMPSRTAVAAAVSNKNEATS